MSEQQQQGGPHEVRVVDFGPGRDPHLDGGRVQPPAEASVGWISRGRCPVDANMVHVERSIATPSPDVLRVEVLEGASPAPGMLVTPTEFDGDTTVDLDHACGVPATRVGPFESPLGADEDT